MGCSQSGSTEMGREKFGENEASAEDDPDDECWLRALMD